MLGWGGLTALLMSRELGVWTAVMAYKPSARWLPVVPLVPVMTVMTWAACCVASLTRDRAALQFKGARQLPGKPGA